MFEAVQTVRYTPLQQWIDRGKDKHYVLKRLKAVDNKLTSEAIAQLRAQTTYFKNKPYDLVFAWSDKAIYCSELV